MMTESVVTAGRVYCSVYGCLNSSLTKPTLTFFRLPADATRRSEWLRLMSREDLAQKIPQSYRVCEEHFNERDILSSPQRKLLKKNTLPTVNLPGSQKRDEATQTLGDPEYAHIEHRCQSAQTEKTFPIHKATQTTQILSLNTPCMRKLKSELVECRKKIRSHEIGLQSRKVKRATFHKLCDNLLGKKLAMIVKANTNLKVHSQGNRYDEDYIAFCLKLYTTSPDAYRLLQTVLCMPCPSTLYNLKNKKTKASETTTDCEVQGDL